MKDVIVIGAGGHGRVIADIVRACNDNFLGFLDDKQNVGCLGNISDYKNFSNAEFVIAIGNADVREKLANSMQCKWYTAVHPSAIISPSASINEGTVIMPNAVVNANAVIGKHCIINTTAVVEHDNIIQDFVHISVGTKLGGTVLVGRKTWVGIGATVSNNISICSECLIGAGAVVVNNIDKKGTYIGVPVKLIG